MSKLKDIIAKLRIPKHTCYCYSLKKGKRNRQSWMDGYKIKKCPYWKALKYKDCHDNPIYYCKYLKMADTYQRESLLWDMCKECGVNDDYE